MTDAPVDVREQAKEAVACGCERSGGPWRRAGKGAYVRRDRAPRSAPTSLVGAKMVQAREVLDRVPLRPAVSIATLSVVRLTLALMTS